ncbi:MAG: hypothetical protein QM762_12390 [Chryseolinea sp.]
MKTVLHGHSDDLIEVVGAIEWEADYYAGQDIKVSFSDETLVSMSYGCGWKIKLIQKGSLFEKLIKTERGVEHTDLLAIKYKVMPDNDVLILNKGVEWVTIDFEEEDLRVVTTIRRPKKRQLN